MYRVTPMKQAPHVVVGVDEAGRGAVLGPLVLAGCGLSAEGAAALHRLGAADSKGFGPPVRAQRLRSDLARSIQEHAAWYRVVVVSPSRVDAAVRRHGLNALEREVAEELLTSAPPATRVVFDGKKVFEPLSRRVAHGIALDKADRTELSVSAASILAKTERDRHYAEIRARYEPTFGPIRGEGYPNRATERFLEAYLKAHGELPPETRRSWSWAPLLAHTTPAERGEQPTLDFGNDDP